MSVTVEVAQLVTTLQGEAALAGYPCTLVRLAGCSQRCRYCDTEWARERGTPRSVEEVVAEAERASMHHVLVTGGEPLEQPSTPRLLRSLCDKGLLVVLETSGSSPTDEVDPRVRVVLDVKCPGSGMADGMHWPNLDRLRRQDEVKFVLVDRGDYDYALSVVRRHEVLERAGAVLFSPASGFLEPEMLARWMLADRLTVRLGLQLHKLAWPGLE